MRISDALRRPGRVLAHLLFDQSYERYHSADVWEQRYARDRYDLSVPKEDGRYGALIALVGRYDRGGPVLDAGCGDGLLAQHYRRVSDSRLVGIDYSPAAIDAARGRRLPDTEFHAADFTRFHATTPFSVIVFNEALYYVANQVDLLASFESDLKPGGVFVVSMFDTAVTRRIWKALRQRYRPLQTVLVEDGQSGTRWTISVFPRPGDSQ